MKSRKLLATLLSAAALACAMAGASGLGWAEQAPNINLTAGSASMFDASLSGELQAQAADYPSSFDLRSVDTDGDNIGDTSYVTPVKNQRPFGDCWGFSATASAESAVLSDMLQYGNQPEQPLDFSEKQIAYFAYQAIADPDSPQYGEGWNYFKGEPQKAADTYSIGGAMVLAQALYAAGVGPVYESKAEMYKYKGEPGNITYKQREDGTEYPFCYSEDDDWTLLESARFSSDYVLKEAYELPSPKPDFGSSEYNPDGVAAIKEQLYDKRRTVSCGFFADTSRPWETGKEGTFMSVEHWSHYTYIDSVGNHAITIVGWDDDYPASNFIEGHEPPGNGAWLVKNSWGAGTEEFANAGSGDWGIPVQKTDENGNPVYDDDGNPVMVGSGYFWLSYYDRTVTTVEAFDFDSWYFEGGFDWHRDQHDLMPPSSYVEIKSDNPVKSANVFSPDGYEIVGALTYQVASPGTDVKWKVYLLNPDARNPEEGVLMASGENTHKYSGFYIDYLPSPMIVHAGQRYSIVLEEVSGTGENVAGAAFGVGRCLFSEYLWGRYLEAVINEGESYLSLDGEYFDWSDDVKRQAVIDELDTVKEAKASFEGEEEGELPWFEAVLDNFPIKGLATNDPGGAKIRFTGNIDHMEMAVGDKRDVELEAYDDDGVIDFDDREVRWFIEEGDGSVNVIPTDHNGHVVLEGLVAGKYHLVAEVPGLGTMIANVTVAEAQAADGNDGDSEDGESAGDGSQASQSEGGWKAENRPSPSSPSSISNTSDNLAVAVLLAMAAISLCGVVSLLVARRMRK